MVAADEIKIFDDDDKVTKHPERKECFVALLSLSKSINFIYSRRPWSPNLISHLFHLGLFSSWSLLFYTRGVMVEI